jgi:hypothetical protein
MFVGFDREPTLEWSTLKVIHFGRLLALPSNIRLGWKGLPGTNTVAYSEKSVTYGRKLFYIIGHSSVPTFLIYNF